MKNLLTSLVREVTFRTEEKLEQPFIEYKNAQYLYSQGNDLFFMESDLGETGLFEGKKVYLDFPYLNEEEEKKSTSDVIILYFCCYINTY